MIINLNEFGCGGGQVSPKEIEEIVNVNHYTKEESDAIVNNVRDIADDAKAIAEAKQDELVSGTNIKTINGEDILGEGDIEIKVDSYTKEESDARYEKKEGWWVPETSANTYVALLLTDGSVQVDYFTGTSGIIGSRKYYNRTNIAEAIIGDGIKSIQINAFQYCSNLTNLVLPSSVTNIGNDVFRDCTSLRKVTIHSGVTFGNYVFCGCTNLKDVKIDDGVTKIGNSIFSGCTSLENIVIPDGVTTIDYGAFNACTSLSSVTLPSSFIPTTGCFNLVPTGGTLYCDETWFNNLDFMAKLNIGNVANWTRKPLPKPIEERVDNLETDVTTLKTDVNEIKEDIKDIELVKTPNVVLFGTPSIQNGQMDSFSEYDYAQFPFLVDLNSYNQWEINFEITVSYDGLSGQHNIFDSNYGLAFAIRDSHFVIAYSNDGTTWTRELTGTHTLSHLQTTYKVKIYYNYLDGDTEFWVNYSTDGGTTWVNDIMGGGSYVKPHPTQIIIGKALNNSNVFYGIVNLNACNLITNYNVKWQGMDDVGLSTRLATDMSNIDAAGVQKVKDIIGGFTLSVLTQEEYDALEVKDSNTLYFIK